jgi:uncharacterized membrane protein YesL
MITGCLTSKENCYLCSCTTLDKFSNLVFSSLSVSLKIIVALLRMCRSASDPSTFIMNLHIMRYVSASFCFVDHLFYVFVSYIDFSNEIHQVLICLSSSLTLLSIASSCLSIFLPQLIAMGAQIKVRASTFI